MPLFHMTVIERPKPRVVAPLVVVEAGSIEAAVRAAIQDVDVDFELCEVHVVATGTGMVFRPSEMFDPVERMNV